jgi:hypothetical protein
MIATRAAGAQRPSLAATQDKRSTVLQMVDGCHCVPIVLRWTIEIIGLSTSGDNWKPACLACGKSWLQVEKKFMNTEKNSGKSPLVIDVDEPVNLSLDVDSVAVQRLIEEVRSSDSVAASANYNRTYNRHNR